MNCYTGGGAASASADADKKEKAPKGGTAVKVTCHTCISISKVIVWSSAQSLATNGTML